MEDSAPALMEADEKQVPELERRQQRRQMSALCRSLGGSSRGMLFAFGKLMQFPKVVQVLTCLPTATKVVLSEQRLQQS